MNVETKKSIMTLTILAAIAGVWLLISPYGLPFTAELTATRNDVTLGIITAILGFWYAYKPERTTWMGWLNGILGLWVVISPWTLRFAANTTATWNNVVTGLIIAVLSGWAAALGQPDRLHRHAAT